MPRVSVYQPGPVRDSARGGGATLLMRPHYPATVARALAKLAESNPTPSEYAREKARILEAHRCTTT